MKRFDEGEYGPCLFFEEGKWEEDGDEPTVGYYDGEDVCDDCGSTVASVIRRDGSEALIAFENLFQCPPGRWEKERFDVTAVMYGPLAPKGVS